MAFWNKNKHDICPSDKELKTLVTNYLGASSDIRINSKLIVPQGYVCVLGRRGKVADKFEEGEHFLNFANMPYMCRRFGIDKVKDGKQQQKTPCNVYFVNKELMPGKFKTYRKVEMGTRAYGIFKIHVFGMYSYKVANPQELMQSLLNEYDYIKTGESESIIEAWVNDLVVSTLEKKNFVITDIVNNSQIIAESLKNSISKLFETAGLELCELKIYKYKLPKQYQAQSDQIIAQQLNPTQNVDQQNENNAIENISCSEENQQATNIEIEQILNSKILQNDSQTDIEKEQYADKIEEKNTVDTHQNEEYNQNVNQTDYVPFGNFVINNGTIEDMQKPSIKEKQKPKFVDLNLDNLYADKKNNIKRCLNCGAENTQNADHCVLCGEKFIEEDF